MKLTGNRFSRVPTMNSTAGEAGMKVVSCLHFMLPFRIVVGILRYDYSYLIDARF